MDANATVQPDICPLREVDSAEIVSVFDRGFLF
jgi:hypothetical protein